MHEYLYNYCHIIGKDIDPQQSTNEQLLLSQQQYQRKDGHKNEESILNLKDQNNKLQAQNDNTKIANTSGGIINAALNSSICGEQQVIPLPDVVRQEKENITTSQVKYLR